MEVRAWVGGDGVGAWSPSHREGRGWRRTGRQRERRLKPGATVGAGSGQGGVMVKRFILTPVGLTSWFWGRRPGGRGGRGQATPLHRSVQARGAGAGVVKPRPYIGVDRPGGQGRAWSSHAPTSDCSDPRGRGGRGQATPLHRTVQARGAGAGVVKPRPYIGAGRAWSSDCSDPGAGRAWSSDWRDGPAVRASFY